MRQVRYDAVCMGNAIIDIFSPVNDEALKTFAIPRGGMRLLQEAEARTIRASLQVTSISPGGGSANTAAGIVSLGGKAAYIGKVSDDRLGLAFRSALHDNGVVFSTAASRSPPGTGTCLVLSSKDGERSMGTHLGAATELNSADLDTDLIANAANLYIECYLLDSMKSREAVSTAIEIAHGAGTRVSLSLSDTQCVIRHHDLILSFLQRGSIQVLFGNVTEFAALYPRGGLDDIKDACVRNQLIAIMTCSGQGSVICSAKQTTNVPAHPIGRIVDTTGAGDLYAAGFLLALARGLKLDACAALASFAAAQIIQQIGARSEVPLYREARRLGLIPRVLQTSGHN